MSAGIIDVVHEHIHEGKSFIATDYDADTDIVGPKYWSFITPDTNKHIHFIFEVFANAAGVLEFYEGPTINAAGTTLASYNMNRNITDAAGMVVKYDTTTTADGTKLWVARLGTVGSVFVTTSGGTGTRMEFVLKRNTTYILKFTTIADNNILWANFVWYELLVK